MIVTLVSMTFFSMTLFFENAFFSDAFENVPELHAQGDQMEPVRLAAGELPKSNSNSKFQIRIPNSNSRCDLASTRFESGHGPFSTFQNTVYLIYTAYTIYLICTAYTIYTAYTVYLILVISYIRHIQSPVVY